MSSKNSKNINIALSIAGGVGKNIVATALVRELSKKYVGANFYIQTPHRAVWQNNPLVKDIFGHEAIDSANFYKILKDPLTIPFLKEPYADTLFAYKKDHLSKIWGNLCGINVDNIMPEIFLKEEEINRAKIILNDISVKKWGEDSLKKPLFLIQTSGGGNNQNFPISWTRDLPMHIAYEVCQKMYKEGYRVMQIRRNDQYYIEDVPQLSIPLRELFACISLSDKRLFIDSMPEHVSAGLNKPSVVVWIGNDPLVFGYPIHKNIKTSTAKEMRHHPRSYTDEYDITGAIDECPYDTNDLFDADYICSQILN